MNTNNRGVSTTVIAMAVVLVIVVVAAGAYVAMNPGTTKTTTSTTTAVSTATATSTAVSTAISTTTATTTAVLTTTMISTTTTSFTLATNTALSGTLLETGSSLMYPAFNIWVANFSHYYPNIHVTTGSTGSGTGISQAESGAVQIGASDAYMSSAVLAQYPTMLNIPLAISAQQINYNIPNLNTYHLNMSAGVLAAIYNGSITTWNDHRIAALQSPSVAALLPSNTIVPIHRQDSSGDTSIFTQYLSDAVHDWNATNGGPGWGTTISWPAVPGSLAATGNNGMLTALAQTPYSIAYVGISYLNTANQLKFGYAYLQNRAGNFVDISSANIQAAVNARASATPSNEIISLIYAPGANSYPIVNYEYAIVNKAQTSAATAANIQAFLDWIINYGNQQYYLVQVHFVALPSAVKQLSLAQIAQISSP